MDRPVWRTLRNAPQDFENPVPFPDANMDEILDRVEAFVVDDRTTRRHDLAGAGTLRASLTQLP